MAGMPESIKVKLELEGVEEVRRLGLQPGDALVIWASRGTPVKAIEEACRKIGDLVPGHKVVVLPSEWDMDVVRPEPG